MLHKFFVLYYNIDKDSHEPDDEAYILLFFS